MHPLIVVNFNQSVGAVHSKRWGKYGFSTFFMKKLKEGRKSKKIWANFDIKSCFCFHPNAHQGLFVGIKVHGITENGLRHASGPVHAQHPIRYIDEHLECAALRHWSKFTTAYWHRGIFA